MIQVVRLSPRLIGELLPLDILISQRVNAHAQNDENSSYWNSQRLPNLEWRIAFTCTPQLNDQ